MSEQREAIWSVTKRTKSIFYGLLLVQLCSWGALTIAIHDSSTSTINDLFTKLEAVVVVSAGTSFVAAEAMEVVMVLAESIRSAIERRNQRRKEEARLEGLREAHHSWMDWNRRRVLAEKQGKTFDDPPPDIPTD